jgi:uncharacterized protein
VTTLPVWGLWLTLGVMAIGLVGAIVPGIPGTILIWAAALVYGLAGGFASFSPWAFAALTVLAVIGTTSDFWLSQGLGRAGGASGQAMLAGMVLGLAGLIIGLFFAGIGALPGALLGTLAGIIGVEYRRRRTLFGAAKAGAGWLIGYLLSALVEFVIAIVMIGVFIWQTGFTV